MSIRVESRVWKSADAAGGELLVLLALAHFADDEGWCWPSMATIAKKTRMTERSAQRIIRRLVGRGQLFCDPSAGGRGKPNRYRVIQNSDRQSVFEFANHDHKTPSDCQGKDQIKTPTLTTLNPENPDSDDIKTPTLTTLNPDARVTRLLREPSIREGRESNDSSSNAEFDAFWNACPRKVGKAPSRAKFQRLVKSGVVSASDLIAGVKRYAVEVSGRKPAPDGRIPICYPLTWLNQGRWEDESETRQERHSDAFGDGGPTWR